MTRGGVFTTELQKEINSVSFLIIARRHTKHKRFCQTEGRKGRETYLQNTEEGFLRSKHMLSFWVSGETKMQISNVGGVAREREIQNNSCLLFIGQ